MSLKPCPDCDATSIDQEGVSLGDTTGPQCNVCGFWSAREDWTPAQNVAGWNDLERPE